MNNLVLLSLTALITFGVIWGVKRFFPKWGLIDRPQDYGYDRKPVPYPAGIIIPLLFFSIAFALIPSTHNLFKPLIGFAIAGGLITFVSFLDDRFKLSPVLRLGVQFLVACIVIGAGVGISEIRSPIGGEWSLAWGSFEIFGKTIMPIADGLALIWIMGMMNAMNWLDGVSGLTSSVSSIASFILALTAYSFGQPDVAQLFAILGIICGVFFVFDLESPSILMGDSGSMFLGLALAVFTIIAGGKVATAMLVMFVPLFDAAWTIGRRILNGNSPFKGDLEHLHHKLLEKVQSRRGVVLIYAFFVLLFGSTSYFLETQGKVVLLFILFIFLFIVELYLHKK